MGEGLCGCRGDYILIPDLLVPVSMNPSPQLMTYLVLLQGMTHLL